MLTLARGLMFPCLPSLSLGHRHDVGVWSRFVLHLLLVSHYGDKADGIAVSSRYWTVKRRSYIGHNTKLYYMNDFKER